MGIRALLKVHQQLKGINGALLVSNPLKPVKRMLEMMHLGKLLISEFVDPVPAGRSRKGSSYRSQDSTLRNIRLRAQRAARMRRGGLIPLCFRAAYSGTSHSRTMTFPKSARASAWRVRPSLEDCEQRFGEFLSVAGAAAYQPTDGSNVPDYLIAEGSFVPELQVLYALVCKGHFASLARFEANSEPGAVPLSDLAEAALEISGAATVGIAMIAESAGLIGAALRQAPDTISFQRRALPLSRGPPLALLQSRNTRTCARLP
jgi:hypothetical protein